MSEMTAANFRALMLEQVQPITERMDQNDELMEQVQDQLEQERKDRREDIKNLRDKIDGALSQPVGFPSSASSAGSQASGRSFADVSRGLWPARPLPVSQPAGQPNPYMRPGDEKICVTIGGWGEDTKGEIVLKEMTEMTKDIPNISDRYASGKRCKTGKIKFESSGKMWQWVKSMKGIKLQHGGATFWFSVEKSEEELKRSRIVGGAIRALIEKGVVRTEIDADYKKILIWVKDIRVLEGNMMMSGIQAKLPNWETAGLGHIDSAEIVAQVNSR